MDDKVKKVLLKSLLPKNFVSTDEAVEIARQVIENQETHESVDCEQVANDTNIKRK